MKNSIKLPIFLFALFAILFIVSFASAQYYNNYNYSNYNNCTYHAYRLCAGNNIYWYDSCGNQQDPFQSCYGTNLICQYGQCVYNPPVVRPKPIYIPPKNPAPVTPPQPQIQPQNQIAQVLSVSFFAKQDQNSLQWQKAVSAASNGTIYFMASVANNSEKQADNINISANIPSEIASLGNLQVNGAQTSGDIVSGINIGSLALGSAKSITFEGRTQSILTQATKQAIITASVSGILQSDSVSINFNPAQVQAAGASVSSTQSTSGFLVFLKRWYLWILVGLVLIFLFIVVFRRLSSSV